MFALAMLVRLGKVTEHDVRMTFAAFRRLDVGNDGVLNSQDIIVGMMQKRRQSSVQNLVALGKDAADVPPPSTGGPWYFFGRHGSTHVVDEEPELPYPYESEQEAIDPEHESLLQNFSMPSSMESRTYNSMHNVHGEAPAYDSNFPGMSFQSTDLETGFDYRHGTRRVSHQGLQSEGTFA